MYGYGRQSEYNRHRDFRFCDGSDAYRNGDAYSYCDAYGFRDAYGYGFCDVYGYSFCDAHGYGDAYTYNTGHRERRCANTRFKRTVSAEPGRNSSQPSGCRG
jgi:hypothetical protein